MAILWLGGDADPSEMKDLLGVESAHEIPTPLPVSWDIRSQSGCIVITKLTVAITRQSYQRETRLSPSECERSLVISKARVVLEGGFS